MDGITLGQIMEPLIWLAGAAGTLGVLYKIGSQVMSKALTKALAPVNTKLDQLDDKVKASDLDACKNFLVRFLADVEQSQPIDEVERERFYEVYEHYTSPELGGNSYIHDKVEKLKSQGKL